MREYTQHVEYVRKLQELHARLRNGPVTATNAEMDAIEHAITTLSSQRPYPDKV